jgi:hypothetical protein
MTTTEPVTTVDLTAPSESLPYAEILTPAGIVRVNTGLVNVRTGRPVVVIEVTPNKTYNPRTAAEDWDVSVRDVGPGIRTDVTLTRLSDLDSTSSERGEPDA